MPSIHVSSVPWRERALDTTKYLQNFVIWTLSHDCSVFTSLSKELEELESALNGICYSVVVSAYPRVEGSYWDDRSTRHINHCCL